MDGHERWLVRASKRNHGAGIQESAPGSDIYRVAGMGRASSRYTSGIAALSLSGAAARRAGGALRRPDNLGENSKRCHRVLWNETLRQFRAGVAASENGRAHHQRAHGTAPGRTVSTGVSSALATGSRRFGPGNRASVLGPIRACHSAKPGALDVDV